MNSTNDLTELALFRIDDDVYGIQIEHIQEINRAPDLTRVPGSDPFVKGVMNLRGEIVTILDLPKKLGYEKTIDEKTARVLVVKYGHERVGVLVDEMNDIIPVEPNRMDSGAIRRDGADTAYFSGVYTLDDALVVVLDINSVLYEGELSSSIN